MKLSSIRLSALTLSLALSALSSSLAAALDCPPGRPGSGQQVTQTGAVYKPAPAGGTATLKTGMEADLVLSAVGFDDSGGPLLFNHNGGLATDGRRLVLCDRNNNRVLIWNSLPSGNVAPDLVLGQTDFRSIAPGSQRDQMSWPIAASTDGTRLLVADTYNDRILIWTSFPTRSGQAADLVLRSVPPTVDLKASYAWPWGVWTDGRRVVVTGTGSGAVLIWNSFPARDDQPADLRLTGGGKFGTPRGVVSDGRSLIVGDHNAKGTASQTGNWVWRTFPTTDDAPVDYFLPDPCDANAGQMNGEILSDGKLVLLGRGLYIWNTVPRDASVPPDSSVAYDFFAGDGSDVAVASGRLYISTANANKLVGFSSFPTSSGQKPDIVIGSPDLATNTLDTQFIISNPVPASNGRSLFVTSDFDRKLYVWKSIPDESAAHPDIVYSLPDGPWDNALFGETFVTAGARTVQVWKRLPVDGQPADVTFTDKIGTTAVRRFSGVALDAKYLYVSDTDGQKIHVFRGIPSATDAPAFSLELSDVVRLDSDGTYLVATRANSQDKPIVVYRVADLGATATGTALTFSGFRLNLPQYATVYGGRLFIGDTNGNRVIGWSRMDDALAGRAPDLILGASDLSGGLSPRIGKSTFFWPATPVFDGRYLWVGEFKFSERLLRFGGSGGGTPEPSFSSVSFVPAVAGTKGSAGSSWVTDLTIFNPDPGSARTVKLAFLAAGLDNRSAVEVSVEVAPRRALVLPDVVGRTLGTSGGGGLRLRATGAVLADSRTYDASAPAGRFTGVSLSALAPSAARASGSLFPLSSQTGASGTRSNVGFLNPLEVAARVDVELLDAASGTLLGRTRLELPPLGFAQLSDVFAALGATGDVSAGAVSFTSTVPIFGFAIVLENATSVGRYIPAQ